jgi:predicted dithiol-disulfide oxidoreductase (DUF899 family)
MNYPEIVSVEEWQRAHDQLLAEEKAHMREGDRLAAVRRRHRCTRSRSPTASKVPTAR